MDIEQKIKELTAEINTVSTVIEQHELRRKLLKKNLKAYERLLKKAAEIK